jgi:hypothetical protein
MSFGCVSPVSTSGIRWPAMEISVTAATWSLRLGLDLAMAQLFNKIKVSPLDLDLEVLASFHLPICCGSSRYEASSSFSSWGRDQGVPRVLECLAARLATGEQRSCSREYIHGGSVSAVVHDGRKATTPNLFVGVVHFGCRQQVSINLQAKMPRRRPFYSCPESSRRPTPSGSVPGGAVLVCAARCINGGAGAGLDCFCSFHSRVLCANSMDLLVLSVFYAVLLVFVPPLFNESL